jgi:hypothetical protein
VATIPRYDEPQVLTKPIPGAQAAAVASPEAFGGGKSADALGDATKGLAKTVGDVYQEEKLKADDVATQEAYAKTVQLRNKIMYDPQNGAMTKRGKDAFGVVDTYVPQFDKGAEEIEKSLSNEEQKAMYRKLLLQQKTDLNDSLQKHTFTESMKYDEDTAKAGVETQRDDAVLNYQTPGRVEQSLKMQEALIRSRGERTGAPADAVDLMVADARSKTHTSVIQRMLANDQVDEAKKYYDANKPGIGAGEVTAVEKSLEDAQGLQRGVDAWKKVSGMRLGDGLPDEARMHAAIDADQSLGLKEKEKAWDFVKARAGEEIANKSRNDASRDRTFMNTAIQARKQGLPLDQALKLGSQFSNDAYDQAIKEDAIKKIYAPATVVTNPAVKVALLDGIQEGTVTKEDIDNAFRRGDLSAPDWEHARSEYHNVVAEGKSPEMQRANEQVKILAESNFGSDKEKVASFLSEVKSAARGKTPDEYQKIARDKLAIDPTTQHSFFGLFNWGGNKQYETDSEKRNATSLAFGKATQDLGAETVKAIQNSALRKGAKQFTPADFDAFTVEMGGYDKMKPGTPAFNAIQSLSKRGELVTTSNVKAVLARFPDGNY